MFKVDVSRMAAPNTLRRNNRVGLLHRATVQNHPSDPPSRWFEPSEVGKTPASLFQNGLSLDWRVQNGQQGRCLQQEASILFIKKKKKNPDRPDLDVLLGPIWRRKRSSCCTTSAPLARSERANQLLAEFLAKKELN